MLLAYGLQSAFSEGHTPFILKFQVIFFTLFMENLKCFDAEVFYFSVGDRCVCVYMNTEH